MGVFTEERVSPPPSHFLMEDAMVLTALDKYSDYKKSRDDLTDHELLDIEERQGYYLSISLSFIHY